MRLTPLSRLAYRCQGGSIEATAGPLSIASARSELDGLRDLAGRCMTCGDLAGAEFVAGMIEQLGDACQAVCSWARAA